MRHISPEIFSDEFFGTLLPEFRLLFIGLIACLPDDQGRLIDNAALICASIFPYDQQHMNTDSIERGLALFAKHKKIIRYCASNNGSGRKLIQIANWWKYQSSAHWAARSKYPPPDKWIDRIRTHEGQQIITVNWDKSGGLLRGGHHARMLLQRSSYVGRTKHQRSTSAGATQAIDDVNDEDRGRGRHRGSTRPPPNPLQERTAGGIIEKEKRIDFDQLKGKQREAAEQARKILIAASLRDSRKVNSLSAIVATRIGGDPIAVVLGAFAAAYADETAQSKPAIAAYRIEHEQTDPQWQNPKAWRKLPAEILKAAGIHDIEAYIRRWQMREFAGEEQP
jgi:hypothetical protein